MWFVQRSNHMIQVIFLAKEVARNARLVQLGQLASVADACAQCCSGATLANTTNAIARTQLTNNISASTKRLLARTTQHDHANFRRHASVLSKSQREQCARHNNRLSSFCCVLLLIAYLIEFRHCTNHVEVERIERRWPVQRDHLHLTNSFRQHLLAATRKRTRSTIHIHRHATSLPTRVARHIVAFRCVVRVQSAPSSTRRDDAASTSFCEG